MNALASMRATPFHARAAEANRRNAWTIRNGFTLASAYTDENDEALAARTSVVVADISWRWRVALRGANVVPLLNRLLTRDVSSLEPGESLKALWLTDNGAVRAAGVVARYGRESFVLAAAAPDAAWIVSAARHFGVTQQDVTNLRGGLALIGPYSEALLARAGLRIAIEPLQFRRVAWRGIDLALSRWGEHGGYEIWCNAEDGPVVWDRIVRAGDGFGLQPAGVAAMDILDIEAGVVRPVRDYEPARGGFDRLPTPLSLGLEGLIDAEHSGFNGRAAWAAQRESEAMRLVSLELESIQRVPHNPISACGRPAGHTMASCYSPVLRRAIALAQVEHTFSEIGTAMIVALAPTRDHPQLRTAAARVVSLPLVAAPDSVAA